MKQKEKESYIQAMLYVAKIDGIKKEEELRVIRELAEKLNVENIEQKIPHLSNELFEGKELRDVLSHVHGRGNKLALIYQLVVLAYADGIYSPEKMMRFGESVRFYISSLKSCMKFWSLLKNISNSRNM